MIEKSTPENDARRARASAVAATEIKAKVRDIERKMHSAGQHRIEMRSASFGASRSAAAAESSSSVIMELLRASSLEGVTPEIAMHLARAAGYAADAAARSHEAGMVFWAAAVDVGVNVLGESAVTGSPPAPQAGDLEPRATQARTCDFCSRDSERFRFVPMARPNICEECVRRFASQLTNEAG